VRGVAYMLELPAPPSRNASHAPLPADAAAARAAAAAAAPTGAVEDGGGGGSGGGGSGGSGFLAPAAGAPAGWSMEGLPRILRHGAAHFPPYARLASRHYDAFGASLLRQVSHQTFALCFWSTTSHFTASCAAGSRALPAVCLPSGIMTVNGCC